jgi:TolA-binding protein
MNLRVLALAALTALAPAASLAQDLSLTLAQADYREPLSPPEALDNPSRPDATELALLKDAYVHIDRAGRDRQSGNLDAAAAEDKIAADNLVGFVNKYTNHRLHIVFLRMATVRYLNSKEWQAAAEAATRMVQDPRATALTKAVGARYASGAWQMLAVQEMKAGKIPQLKLQPSTARGGVAPTPRTPDLPWKMFVENADIYSANADADPANKLDADGKRAAGGADPAMLELIAAQVEFGYDNIEDAQRRFGKLIEKYPSRADILETAVPYYLDSFKILKNTQGLEAALTKVEPGVAAAAKQAAEQAAAPGASEEAKKSSATLTRLATELRDATRASDYATAAALMQKGDAAPRDGKTAPPEFAQAGALFEKYANENKASPDAPNALFNAGIAYDKAKEPKKAVAVREALLAGYPDAKVAQQTTVILGGTLAASREYSASAKYNQQYLTRWPDGPQRCTALQNLGVAQQELKKPADAADSYLRFAADPTCAGEDPNATARILYSAAKMQADAKKPAEAKKALQQLVALKGVTDVVAKSYQTDAKERLAKMK